MFEQTHGKSPDLIICLYLFTLLATAAWSEPAFNGYYVGEFVADRQDRSKNPMHMNKINLSIDSVEGGKVRGHSVVAGNNRPFLGTYARHGYSFQDREMRYLFDRVSWYIPVSTDVTAQLTAIEKKNIEILKRYENHATNYYDRFGR